jgi:predicted GNAT family acetyltransferase
VNGTTNHDRYDIQDRPGESRYVLLDHGDDGAADQAIGEERYKDIVRDAGRERIFYHTEVAQAYEGQGLASMLVRRVIDDAIAAGLVIVPVCPYVAAWLARHPEYATHVLKPAREHFRAIRGDG